MGGIWKSRERDERTEDTAAGDARLVEGLRRGAPTAFAGLHEQYAAGIYNLALRVVRHAPDAEDITQDVLIRAYERLPRDREVLLRPWLYRLTLNRCYDYLRGSARRPVPAAPGRDVPAPDDPFEQSELQRLLDEALGDLTRRQRAALLLKDVHGLSLVEVGACLELTPGSVEVLLARARKAFRAAFEDRCRAAGRPLPGAAAGLTVALPLVPLPPALAAPTPAFAPPTPAFAPPAPPAAAILPPLTAMAGSGISAALGLPSSIKTAVLVAAAAATMGTAEVAVVQQADQRPPRAVAAAVRASAEGAVGATQTTPHTPPATPAGEAAPLAVAAPSHRVTPEPDTPSPAPEGPSGEEATPTPAASPLAITTPAASPQPDASPSATATTPPEPPASPGPAASSSPSASPESSPAPSPSASPSPHASPSS